MASILRQIVAGPRARHEETGLDLCYVTSNIIATSGPSQTYPQRAYRNPLDRLVAFLDDRHGDNWAIWEFRAEGTGYPDEAVYGRIRHYPWPDHHPPPFRVVPLIMASMRNWLAGGELHGSHGTTAPEGKGDNKDEDNGRVVVVHCKAGKGRSGSMACSFLISERGWTAEAALARFTERRMRPRFGAGVSIPSQLRWISYVDRWTKGEKRYVDRAFEIVEIHAWGLRSGVKMSVEGFADEGSKIKVLHTFTRDERVIVEGDTPGSGGIAEIVPDLTKLAAAEAVSGTGEEADYEAAKSDASKPGRSKSLRHSLIRKLSKGSDKSPSRQDAVKRDLVMTSQPGALSGNGQASSATSLPPLSDDTQQGKSSAADKSTSSQQSLGPVSTLSASEPGRTEKEPGGMAVIFKPREPIRVDNSDVNIALERRNGTPASMGLTMVTAVAHVWFNIFFEGKGPEQNGRADDSGVFEIEWDKMDGIKGSSRKGTRGLDRMAVVWRVLGTDGDVEAAKGTETMGEVREPGFGEDVPEMKAADWKGDNKEDPDAEKHLGLRASDPDSANVSKASSVNGDRAEVVQDSDSLKGVKASGPGGEELDDEGVEMKLDGVTGRRADKGETGKSVADATAQNGFIVE